MDLPVYLIHWNAPQWLAAAARSVLASEGVRVRITVIDNGGAGDGPAVSDVVPDGVRVLSQAENRGYTGGANAALEDWRATFPDAACAVIGTHDLHVAPDALARLLAAAEANPRFGILAPVVTAPNPHSGGVFLTAPRDPRARDVPERERDRAWFRVGAFHLPLEGVEGLAERDWVSGTCMLIRRECADAVGAFDERFGSYAEDVDYALRARDAGWRVGVVAEATAWGLGSVSAERTDLMLRNRTLLAAKRGGWRGVRRLVVPMWRRGAVNAVASFAPWRSAEARRRSRSRAGRMRRALGTIDLRGAREMVRERRGSRRPSSEAP